MPVRCHGPMFIHGHKFQTCELTKRLFSSGSQITQDVFEVSS
jgi:hypothetical protein